MSKYHDPNFDKQAYDALKKRPSKQRKLLRLFNTLQPRWSAPPRYPITKKALLSDTKARRKLIGEAYFVWMKP